MAKKNEIKIQKSFISSSSVTEEESEKESRKK